MTIFALCLGLVLNPVNVDKSTLEFYQDTFVIRQRGTVLTAPLKIAAPRPVLSVNYRRNNTYAVWDDRGLSIRQGKHIKSYLLGEISVSPRAFTRLEIIKTLELVKKGVRRKEANALSGSRRVGSMVYLLVRWDESSGHPWAEALVSVDLADPKPMWRLRGKFDGFSTAMKPIEDRLTVVNGQLGVVVRRASDWGFATFEPSTNQFDFRILGDRLLGLRANRWFSEKTSYGTTLVGTLNLADATRTVLAEARGSLKFLDNGEEPPLLVGSDPTGSNLINAATGGKLAIPTPAGIRRIGKELVIWTPLEQPKLANLYDADSLELLAQWKKPVTPDGLSPATP